MATHCSILAWRNPMDRGARGPTVHGVAQSRTQLSDEAEPSTRLIHFAEQQKLTQHCKATILS